MPENLLHKSKTPRKNLVNNESGKEKQNGSPCNSSSMDSNHPYDDLDVGL